MDELLSILKKKFSSDNDIDHLNGILVDLAVSFEGYFFNKKKLCVFKVGYKQFVLKGSDEADSIASYLFHLVENDNFTTNLKPTIIWVLGKIFTHQTLDNLLEYLKKIHNQNFDKAVAYQLIVSIDNFIQLRSENKVVDNMLKKYNYTKYFGVMAPQMDERFNELLNELS